MQSLTERTLRGLGWSVVGVAGQSVVRLGAVAVLARYLSPADFGLFGAALLVFAFLESVSTLNLPAALIQKKSIDDADIAASFTGSVIASGAFAVMVALLAPTLARLVGSPDTAPLLRLGAAAVWLRGVTMTSWALAVKKMDMRFLAVTDFFGTFLGYAAVSILMAWAGFGAWSLLAGYFGQLAITGAATLHRYRGSLRLGFGFSALRRLFTFGGHLSVSNISTYFALNGDYLVVSRLLGATALGLYGRAYQLTAAPASFFSAAVGRVVFPAMSSVQHEPDRLKTAFVRGLTLCAFLTVPSSALMVVLAPEVVALLLGPKWSGVVTPLMLLAPAAYFRVAYKISGTLIQAVGKTSLLARTQLLYAGMVLAFSLAGASIGGINGVALGVSIAVVLEYAVLTWAGAREVHLALRSILSLHWPSAKCGLVVATLGYCGAALMRELRVSDPLVLLVTAVLALAGGVLSVVAFPRIFLGINEKWWLGRLGGLGGRIYRKREV